MRQMTWSLVSTTLLSLSLAGCTNQVGDEGMSMGAGLVVEGADEQALTRECATAANPIRGIDVSRYQGTINWDQVKGDGVEYAFIRVSDGLANIDSKFSRNWAEAKRVGVRRGAYQYFRPNLSVQAQANLMLERMGTLEEGDLPPVLDLETTSGLSKATVAARAKEWLDIVEAAAGIKPIVYTSGYFFRDEVGSPSWGDEYPLWVAHYTTGCALTPQPWSMWTFHQFTDSGSVAGITTGGVDTNRFNGTLADLDALTVGGAGPGSLCEQLSVDGGAVDENDHCARLAGPSNFLRSETDDGAVGGAYVWTGATASDRVYNSATWTLSFAEAGTYKISAHLPAGAGTSQQARYELTGAITQNVVVDQSTASGSAPLATATVSAGDRITVRLNDNTGEDGSLSRRVVFDAIMVFNVLDNSEPEPVPEATPEGSPDSEPEPTGFLSCGDLDGDAMVVSEDEACVDLLGPSEYLRSDSGGHGGSHVWTGTTGSAATTSAARYNLEFNESGRYLVEAYLPAGAATSRITPYTVTAADGTHNIVINQSANRDFVGVGVFEFSADSAASIIVHDNTGEGSNLNRRLVFDAIRITPVAALTCTAASITATTLNVRHTPDTTQSAAGQVQGGDIVDAMGMVSGQSVSGDSGWIRIRKGILTGWVSRSFLTCADGSDPDPEASPEGEPDSEPDTRISEVDHSYLIGRMSGADADPFDYPETRVGFQEYLDAVGVTFFSASEYIAPNNVAVATSCGFSELLPPRTMWRRAGSLGLLADELRTVVGESVTLRNWWRPACYNAGVGGAAGGDHPDADALDLDFQSARSRADAQRYLCTNYWAPDYIPTSDIAPGANVSRKLNLSVGLGGVSIHLGLLSDNGRRFWKYGSYSQQSNSGSCW